MCVPEQRTRRRFRILPLASLLVLGACGAEQRSEAADGSSVGAQAGSGSSEPDGQAPGSGGSAAGGSASGGEAGALPTEPPLTGWRQVPMVTRETRLAGFEGGEGGQWLRALAVSEKDPSFLLVGIDVGGIYRSLDGGRNWQITMVGFMPRGANAVAIDPLNPKRVLIVGGNSIDWNTSWSDRPAIHGVYLSTDGAASFKQVRPGTEGYVHRDALVFARSACDTSRGFCPVAYYSSPAQGLLATNDGGASWQVVNAGYGGVRLKAHATRSVLYAAAESGALQGLFTSADGGKTFVRRLSEPIHGIDVVASRPDTVYVSTVGGVRVSADSGETFTSLGASGIPADQALRDVTVSPAAPDRMLAWWTPGAPWEGERVYSHDGGRTWQKIEYDATHSFLPFVTRNGLWAFHPTDAETAYGIGGDFVARSTNGGKTFGWWSNGENAVMVGGAFTFSALHPDVVYFAFQDYNGAVSRDGGRTFTYTNVSGQGWGGFVYGGHALDEDVLWAGNAESWAGARELRVSRDGGQTWQAAKTSSGTTVTWSGPDVSSSDPRDSNVGFASNFRTTDRGLTWQAMPSCEAVYTYDPTNGRLFGKKGEAIVASTDHGATFSEIGRVPGGIGDLAYDHVRDRFWVVSEATLKKLEGGSVSTVEIPRDQLGGWRVASVAVDPVDPNVVYASNHRDTYTADNSVVRSLDGGLTWQNLAVTTPLASAAAPGGPHEVSFVRVHPTTRELWAAGQCFGVWKHAKP